MAAEKITFQDILNKSNPAFKKPINYVGFKKDEYANAKYYEGTPEDFKEEIENRLKKVNASARTNPNILHRRSKTLQKFYLLLAELKYDDVERVKTLPAKIKTANTKSSLAKRSAIAKILDDSKPYQKLALFDFNLNTNYIGMTNEAETAIMDYAGHLYKDLL